MTMLSLEEARGLFGSDLIDGADLRALLGREPDAVPAIPFARDAAAAAQQAGCLLIYRPAALADGGKITLASLAKLCTGRSDGLVAFASEDPWFLDDDSVNADAAEPGWALVAKEPWRETLNHVYQRGEEALHRRAGAQPWRRRRAAEIAFDTLAYAAADRGRLLGAQWDWSSTRSRDGSFVNIGRFGESGLDVLSYSKAVKHGALGICPTLVGTARG